MPPPGGRIHRARPFGRNTSTGNGHPFEGKARDRTAKISSWRSRVTTRWEEVLAGQGSFHLKLNSWNLRSSLGFLVFRRGRFLKECKAFDSVNT